MKKIPLIIGILCFSLISCNKIHKQPIEEIKPPAVKDIKNNNIKDVIYPIHTFVGRDGDLVTGFMYVVEGDTIIINRVGGIIKY